MSLHLFHAQFGASAGDRRLAHSATAGRPAHRHGCPTHFTGTSYYFVYFWMFFETNNFYFFNIILPQKKTNFSRIYNFLHLKLLLFSMFLMAKWFPFRFWTPSNVCSPTELSIWINVNVFPPQFYARFLDGLNLVAEELDALGVYTKLEFLTDSNVVDIHIKAFELIEVYAFFI